LSDHAQSYQPIERRKVYELIAEQLIGQIGDRRLQPGDALPPERELTRLYGAGRSSVREALRMLESRGLIESVGNGSFVVAPYGNPLNSSLQLLLSLDEGTMHDIFELRRLLESEAAGLAAARRTEAHLEAMGSAIDDMAASLEPERPERFIDADLRFHLAVAEATGNRLVLHSMHAVRDVVRRALSSVFRIPQSPQRALEEHRAIRAAIDAQDPQRAREEMRAHLVRVERDVSQDGHLG
jgi:GntR family transcriptional repressor for pyruvate dehydrogenase complex